MGHRLRFRWLFLFSLFAGPLALPLGGQSAIAANNIAQQQKVSVTGKVVDNLGEPIIGANVVVQGQTVGTITDIDGVFKLDVPKGAKLLISFIGYSSKTVEVKQSNIEIVLDDDSQMLGEVEVVAYGVQKKVSVTGAISSVKGEELTKTPTGSISNMLSGQMAGLTTVQYSGEPGSDAANIFVRGQATWNQSAPLIQVDGVERSMNDIDPNEIESISILKDASATAVFGVRGANGVVLITTKRGKEGKAKISFTTSSSIIAPTESIKMANSYQYATFYNQINTGDGLNPTFSDEIIQKFKDGSDPVRFPSVDWVDYCLKDMTLQTQHNVNISGGTDRVRYFISAGAYTQGGLFKEFDLPYNLSYQYNRFNYRSNLDIDVTKTTTLSMNIAGNVNNASKPYTGQGSAGMLINMYYSTPFSSPGLVDGKLVNASTDYPDLRMPFTGGSGMGYYGGGFMRTSNNTLNADVQLKQKLDFITKGLSFHIKGSYNSGFTSYTQASASVATYTPVLQEDGTIAYKKYGQNSQLKYEDKDPAKSRDWYMEAALNYSRKFGDHNVTGLVLYNQSKRYYPGGTYDDIPSAYVGFVGRATYDYKTRYMAEFNVGYNGSENFAPGKRYGLFPAGSIGWIVSEESFFKPLKKVINYFKVRASVGMVGNDNNGNNRFLYLPDAYILNDDGYFFGTNAGNKKPGAYEASKSNADVTWEKSVKQNYGIDFSILNEKLNISLDYFKENRRDILSSPDYMPGILGMVLPIMNVGKTENKGYEFQLKWNDKIGDDFRYWANFNLSFARNKIVYKNEIEKNEDWLYETGRTIGSRLIYKFWGYYDETAEARYQEEFGRPIADHGLSLQPGDAVFADLNSDGVIDGDDASRDLGYVDTPEYTAGLNLGFSWKGWDFTAQFTGAWNVDRMLSEFRQPLGDTQNKGLLLYQYENTWRSSADTYTAKFPRISKLAQANNYRASDLYLCDASYLRLKSVELGYNFNMPFMKKIKMNQCRLYVSAYNLFTLTDFMWGDPESRQSDRPNYPLTRVINLGLKVGF